MSLISGENLVWQYYMKLHDIPEKSGNEIKTKEFIQQTINTAFELVYSGEWGLAYLWKGAKNTDVIEIAFRSEIDAVEIEKNCLYHGCGHDSHASILLALSHYIFECDLDKNILLIFQGSEEMIGGAKHIANYLQEKNYNIKQIIALHMTSDLYPNYFSVRNKEITSEGKSFNINFNIKGGHIGIGNMVFQELISSLIMFNKKNSNDVDYVDLTGINSNGNHNVKPTEITIGFSIRSKKKGNTNILKNKLFKFLKIIEGSGIQIYISDLIIDYDIQFNNVKMTDRLRSLIKLKFNELNVVEAPIIGACDDFSAYSKILEIPSLYFFVGAYTGIMDCMHTKDFKVPYESIENAFKVMCEIVYIF